MNENLVVHKPKRSSVGKIIFSLLILIIVISSVAVYIYVYNISRYLDVEDSLYVANIDGTDVYVHFTDNHEIELVGADEYRLYISKTCYKYTGYYWNRLFGNLYFSEKNISSLSNVDDGATPATAVLVCEAAYYIDTISNGDSGIEAMEDTDMLNSSYKTEIMFYDDKLLMDGMLFTRTDDMDPVLAELVRLFIDVNL